MLATYQAKWVNNELHWIDEPPKSNDELTLAITVLPSPIHKTPKPKRQPPKELQGQMQIVGDIFDMSESYQEWEHFK